MCCAPHSPGPVLAGVDKENLPPTSTHGWQPCFHLPVPQLIPFCQYNLPLQGFKAKGSYVFPKAALTKRLDDCKDERDWVPASPPILSQGCCCQYLLQLFAALVGASITAGASMLLESSLHNASYSS